MASAPVFSGPTEARSGIRHQGLRVWSARLRALSVLQLVLVSGLLLVVNGGLAFWYGTKGGTHLAAANVRRAIVSTGWRASLAGLIVVAIALIVSRWRHRRLWPPPVGHADNHRVLRAWLWAAIAFIVL